MCLAPAYVIKHTPHHYTPNMQRMLNIGKSKSSRCETRPSLQINETDPGVHLKKVQGVGETRYHVVDSSLRSLHHFGLHFVPCLLCTPMQRNNGHNNVWLGKNYSLADGLQHRMVYTMKSAVRQLEIVKGRSCARLHLRLCGRNRKTKNTNSTCETSTYQRRQVGAAIYPSASARHGAFIRYRSLPTNDQHRLWGCAHLQVLQPTAE